MCEFYGHASATPLASSSLTFRTTGPTFIHRYSEEEGVLSDNVSISQLWNVHLYGQYNNNTINGSDNGTS